MTLQLFLGVRLPDQPYFRVPVYDVDSNKSVHQLKMDVEPVVKQSKDTLGKCQIASQLTQWFHTQNKYIYFTLQSLFIAERY